ncbi:hypothetical protein SI65_01591 [Aspergillus cristatus]|uniref:Transcription factor domain-containing protein n=1 Tax=Aspergillus cristatus TaxID=573508 RepID=A0A1E3BTA3_ASPCR|nr:hypothetical protein SI65_01591 [Aspergillus cristatus]
MTSAIHLFKLSKFNSEIKCVLYCVGRLYAPYSQPAITDIENWQTNVLHRLRQWKSEIPRHPETSPNYHLNLLCEIKYHELVMLLLRPSPRLQNPSKSFLRECFSSAVSWISVHSLFLCVITMFYCVWAQNGVADEVDFDDLMRALKSASDVLSATGEYWPEAKRSRDVLDRISMATMQPFTQRVNQGRLLSGLQTADDVPSAGDLERPVDIIDEALPSPLAFDSGNTVSPPAPFPLYGARASAFVSTDLLSSFTDTWADVNVNVIGAELLEEQYPSVDEVMQDLFFRDGTQGFEHG